MPGGGAVAVLHDITRIEEVERTQRDFVANVSHELRTPLTSITGYVETLLDHEANLSSHAQEFLTTILKNATRMNRLTEDLLVMARVEAAEQELHPVPISAETLIRERAGNRSLVVTDRGRQRYRLNFIGTCYNLQYHLGLGFKTHGVGSLSCVARGDSVVMRDVATPGLCVIKDIQTQTPALDQADAAAAAAAKQR